MSKSWSALKQKAYQSLLTVQIKNHENIMPAHYHQETNKN